VSFSIQSLAGPFVDDSDRRHLVRLWLRDPELAWKTPEALKDAWNRLYKDVTPENSVFPLEPKIRSASSGGDKGAEKAVV
jgi:hypothetical protein